MKDFIEEERSSQHRGRLEYLPSMALPHNWPHEVHTALAHPKSKVWLHSHVRSIPVCPRIFLCEGRLYSHTNNTSIMFCFYDGHKKANRMLMRCFSEGCSGKACPAPPPYAAPRIFGKWAEIVQDDLRVLRIKRQPPPSPSAPPFPSSLSPAAEDEPSSQPSVLLSWEDAVPKSAYTRTWMRSFFLNADSMMMRRRERGLLSEEEESPAETLPTSIVGLLKHGHATITARASAALAFCPHLSTSANNVVRHTDATHAELLFVNHRDPRCPVSSHRLFAFCGHADCAHVRSPTNGAWVELTQPMASWAKQQRPKL